MRAHLIITEHPYSAVTDANGKFSIPKVPSGEWEFRFWHERPGYIRTVNMAGKDMELKRGTIALKLANEQRDLGQLRVDAAQFAVE